MARSIRLLIPLAVLIVHYSAAGQAPLPSASPAVSATPGISVTPAISEGEAGEKKAATPAPATDRTAKDQTVQKHRNWRHQGRPFGESDGTTQSPFLRNLAPEEFQKFRENLRRWKSLPPDLQRDLRRNEEFRRKRILKEINDAIAQSGLTLDEEQRQLFTFKFAQERRTIEENIRRVVERERRIAVDRLIKELVVEFQSMPKAKAGTTPETSGTEGAPGVKPAEKPSPAAPSATPVATPMPPSALRE
jgi:hypothetical protein